MYIIFTQQNVCIPHYTTHENTYVRCKSYCMAKKKKKKGIYRTAIAEAQSLGTGGSAGPPCNSLFWRFPSHCHISNFLFQMSWVSRNPNKAYLISYHCLPPRQSESHQGSFLSLLRLLQQRQSANAAGHGALSAHLGHWQVKPWGFTLALAGCHPTFCRAGREQSWAATSEVLLCIQVTDYTRLRLTEAKQRHLWWPGQIQRGGPVNGPVNTANEAWSYFREMMPTAGYWSVL